MSGGLQSRSTDSHDPADAAHPPISVCRSSPEKVVFIEGGNTDGWISTDVVVELLR